MPNCVLLKIWSMHDLKGFKRNMLDEYIIAWCRLTVTPCWLAAKKRRSQLLAKREAPSMLTYMSSYCNYVLSNMHTSPWNKKCKLSVGQYGAQCCTVINASAHLHVLLNNLISTYAYVCSNGLQHCSIMTWGGNDSARLKLNLCITYYASLHACLAI